MKYVIRKVPERDTSYLERLLPGALIYNDVNHEGAIASFVGAIKLANDDALFVQDDMLLAKNFIERSNRYIEKYPNQVIVFANITDHDYEKVFEEGFYPPRSAGWLLCTYIPKRVQDVFLEFMETRARQKYARTFKYQGDDILFNRCLDHYMDEYVFVTIPNLAGHPKNVSVVCKSRPTRLCVNFDYKNAEV